MANFLRFILGLFFIPACFGVTLVLLDGVSHIAGGEFFCVETFALLVGIVSFVFCWLFLPRLVKTYVLGHELTHALWGMFFGAIPTKVRVSSAGGSVNLTKTNFLITLAPYFFPFYTFVVIAFGFGVFLFVKPLPCLWAWMFFIGFTWAFHILFTIETLSQRQPDVAEYGRLFSWTIIYIVNILFVLSFFTVMTHLTFRDIYSFSSLRIAQAYEYVWLFFVYAVQKAIILIKG